MTISISPWIVDTDSTHCWMRIISGSDGSDICNRVAFIEKTPRVRIAPYTKMLTDYQNWEEGPKGDAPWYGLNQASRDWCDSRLRELYPDWELQS